jgi:hypothetical protein
MTCITGDRITFMGVKVKEMTGKSKNRHPKPTKQEKVVVKAQPKFIDTIAAPLGTVLCFIAFIGKRATKQLYGVVWQGTYSKTGKLHYGLSPLNADLKPKNMKPSIFVSEGQLTHDGKPAVFMLTIEQAKHPYYKSLATMPTDMRCNGYTEAPKEQTAYAWRDRPVVGRTQHHR